MLTVKNIISEQNQAIIDAIGVTIIMGYLLRVPIGRGLAKAVRWGSEQWETMPEPAAIFLTRLADWIDPAMRDITGFDVDVNGADEE